LALSRVQITALRCLRHVELALDARQNFIFGPNGAGKTSVLEGIFLLGRGRSFRTRQNSRLIQRGEQGLAVYGEVTDAGMIHRLGVAFAGGRLTKKVDGQEAVGMASLAAILPVYALDPSSHWLVEGGPSERRRFLDWGVFHVEPRYLEAWKTYRRVLSQRNAALKTGPHPTTLRTWTTALLDGAAAVDASRAAYMARLAPSVKDFGRRLLAQDLSVEYRPGWPKGQGLAAALAGAERRDAAKLTTEFGPHRADLELRLGGERLQGLASRGQQKLAAAALVLAQLAVARDDDRPKGRVLLVDDPAAELDRRALTKLLELLADIPAQLVVTGLSREQLPESPGARVFHVEQGELRGV
jgi:DNA replication and repair protein RecF